MRILLGLRFAEAHAEALAFIAVKKQLKPFLLASKHYFKPSTVKTKRNRKLFCSIRCFTASSRRYRDYMRSCRKVTTVTGVTWQIPRARLTVHTIIFDSRAAVGSKRGAPSQTQPRRSARKAESPASVSLPGCGPRLAGIFRNRRRRARAGLQDNDCCELDGRGQRLQMRSAWMVFGRHHCRKKCDPGEVGQSSAGVSIRAVPHEKSKRGRGQ